MQVMLLCCPVVLALAGSGHISPNDALELQLFELAVELNIEQQACSLRRIKVWPDFKSVYAKLLGLQHTKAALDKMAAELDAG